MENITDICELSDENTIISCLKQRFIHEKIYVSIRNDIENENDHFG